MRKTETEIVSAELVNGQLHVVIKQPSNAMYACYPARPVPDVVWKDVYGVVDGMVALVDVIKGKHTPACSVSEQIEFPDLEDEVLDG